MAALSGGGCDNMTARRRQPWKKALRRACPFAAGRGRRGRRPCHPPGKAFVPLAYTGLTRSRFGGAVFFFRAKLLWVGLTNGKIVLLY